MSDLLRGLRRFASGLHRTCPSLGVDDLLQEVALHEATGGACAERLHRIVAARNRMRSCLRHEQVVASRIAPDVDPDTVADRMLPDQTLNTLRLRRIVQARVAAHVSAAPELRPAVQVVLYDERPRSVAAELDLDVSDLYRRAERLRARLREDEQLQRLWLDQTAD